MSQQCEREDGHSDSMSFVFGLLLGLAVASFFGSFVNDYYVNQSCEKFGVDKSASIACRPIDSMTAAEIEAWRLWQRANP